MNFRPAGQTRVPIAAPYLVALQFLPMAARRAEGRLLAVHTDEPKLTIAFGRRYLEDNKRLLSLALPTSRATVHRAYDREIPMWDSKKKQYKMADAKGPRSLVIADLTEITASAMPTDIRPQPVAVTVYLLSNSGQGPSLEVFAIPSGVVSFVRNAAQAVIGGGVRGEIRLRTRVARQVTLARRRHRHVLAVEVTDNGPGIPPELQERIFHPLVSGRDGGSGLGLTLAQNFINQHHGMISFESAPGNTTFMILLPVQENDERGTMNAER